MKKVGTLTLPGGRTLADVVLEAWVRNILAGNQRAISDLMDRLEGKVSDEPATQSGSPLVESIREFLKERPAPEAETKKRAR